MLPTCYPQHFKNCMHWIMGAGLLISYLMFYDPSNTRVLMVYFEELCIWHQTRAVACKLEFFNFIRKIQFCIVQTTCNKEKVPMKSIRVSLNVPSTNKKKPSSFYKLRSVGEISNTSREEIITGFFLVCCTPYVLLKVIPNVDYGNKVMRLLVAVTAGVMFLNSAINPVLYVWRFTESRY